MYFETFFFSLGVALLPGTPERIEPLKEKKKKPKPTADGGGGADEQKAHKLGALSAAAAGGKMSKAAKMRALSRGDHQEQSRSSLEKQQVSIS